MDTITILIADDYDLARAGIKMILQDCADIKIIGESVDGLSTVKTFRELRPAVVLMDIGMPGIDGIEATRQIKQASPKARILMLTANDRGDEVFAALAAGADGYCLKANSMAQLAPAIRSVFCGAAWLDPGIARLVLNLAGSQPSGSQVQTKNAKDKFFLSSRETEVLKLIVDGRTNSEIANALIVSTATVKTHVRHVIEKLAVSDRTQAAVKALRHNLV